MRDLALSPNEESGMRQRLDGRLAVSPHEAAALLGLDPRTIYRLIWSKALPAKKLGKSWLIAVSTLEQILTDASDLPLTPPAPR